MMLANVAGTGGGGVPAAYGGGSAPLGTVACESYGDRWCEGGMAPWERVCGIAGGGRACGGEKWS